MLLLALPLLFSCFDDNSSGPTIPLSNINIESGIDSVYNLEKNEVLEILPVVSQENTPKELKYTWEVNQKVYSVGIKLTYVAETLGVFNARLIVENEDGKTFFPFTINVNSPYEEGITVLSKDTNGVPMLAFMRTPFNKEEKGQFYEYDCFSMNNENLHFASNPADIVHTTGSIVIACQGSEKENDKATVYFLNDKTFIMENIVVNSEYDGFKPTKLMIPSNSVAGVSYHLLSADGKMYGLPVYDALLQPSTKLFSTYSQACIVEDDGTAYFDILFWDKEAKNVALMYNGYGPYYYGEKYLLQQKDSVFATDNYFKDIDSFVTMTGIRRTKAQTKTTEREMLLLAKSEYGDVLKLVISTFPWRGVEGKTDKYVIQDNGGLKDAGTKSPLTENTPCVANRTYETLLFADGNKVRRWYYNSTKQLRNADELCKVGSDNAIITSIDISEDHKITYVAFYEPNQEGLNGSVWMFDTKTGEVLEKHNNVCYQPVKIIYKKK